MDDLEALKTRQIVAGNVKLGISTLHYWIKGFESLPHLSYRLDIKKLSMRKANRLLVNARKKKVQRKFRHQSEIWWMLLALGPQMMTMLLENSSVAPVIASSITEIGEIMIRKLPLVMITIACGHEIDSQKFKEFCLAPAKFYLALYFWYYMLQSLHKVLIQESLLRILETS
ncbi:hypothetical protein TNIN_172581 [Trichonephila inaurata madagascariensis]|uniref:Uncharacterized protein n=1 Tax=Trichonephila inaurata madagascariensis TaxID=2747483 RepID=A0A8X6YJS7_9ARAC|nr:hypothetical protein TNIN_172581 [Trichonephila inaurata madagascariensis]